MSPWQIRPVFYVPGMYCILEDWGLFVEGSQDNLLHSLNYHRDQLMIQQAVYCITDTYHHLREGGSRLGG